jgi:hypothetical protein
VSIETTDAKSFHLGFNRQTRHFVKATDLQAVYFGAVTKRSEGIFVQTAGRFNFASHTCATLLHCVIETLVDLGDLFHPAPPFQVFQAHDLSVRPMKVISDIGYLLKQTI